MSLSGECVQWLNQRTNLEKTLMTLSLILLLTCFLIIVFGISYGKIDDTSLEQPVCSSQKCFKTGGLMLSMMKPNIDPCENFYEYSCGQYYLTKTSFLDQHKITVKDETSDSVRLSLKHWFEAPLYDNKKSSFQKAKILYSTCIAYGEHDFQEDKKPALLLEVIRDQMNGNWPILDQHWDKSDLNLQQQLSSLILLDVPVAFKIEVVLNSLSVNKYILKISPGGPFLVHHEPEKLRNDPVLKSYLENILILLGVKKCRIEMEVDEIIAAESLLFKLKTEADDKCTPPEKAKNDSSDLGIKTVDMKELEKNMPNFDWNGMLSSIYKTLNIEGNFTIELYCRRYIREYITILLDDFSFRMRYNYLGWRFLYKFISYLGPSFKKLHEDYTARLSGQKLSSPSLPRWKECVMLVEQYMLPAAAAAYIQQEVTPIVLDEVKKIASNLKSSLELLLSSLSWLKEHERQRIKQKVSKLIFEIVLMKYEAQSNLTDQLFSNLELNNDHLIYNILRLQRFMVMQRFQKLGNPKEHGTEWTNQSLTSSLNKMHYKNTIGLYFDQIRSPFLRVSHPGYLNYGGIGFLLSHKLIQNIATLNFDVSKSNWKSLWDLGEERKNMSSCFAHQYSQNRFDKGNYTVDGWKTLMENLADNSAIWIAYNAYERYQTKISDEKLPGLNLTNEQNFFLSFAQSFCEVLDGEGTKTYINSTFIPSELKVNAVLSNFPKFAEIYNCNEKSPLKPILTCNIL